MGLYLQVCHSCLPAKDRVSPDDEACKSLQTVLRKAGLEASVVSVPCLGVCSAPTTLTLQAEKRATYIFKDIDLQEDEADIIATCRMYLVVNDGWIEDARACGKLRHLLHAKIPAI